MTFSIFFAHLKKIAGTKIPEDHTFYLTVGYIPKSHFHRSTNNKKKQGSL